jgi:hypothetical protein
MTVHILKLCVGVDAIEELEDFQRRRLATMRKVGDEPKLRHVTRHRPRRDAEVLDGGSLYWVIRGFVQVRQRIIGLETVETDNGRKCGLVLHPELVRTELQPRRPHQGWRYLDPKDAPADLRTQDAADDDMPPELQAELRELGLL